VNEHGTKDIPAMLDKVHQLKMSELRDLNLLDDDSLETSSDAGSTEKLPYSLCGVSHSLGGAAMLIYLVTRRLEGKPHYMKRAILLSPAGFHQKAPPVCAIIQYLLPILAPAIKPFFPGLYIPTKFFRMLFNKLSRDFQNYPALGGLVQTLISYAVGGDSSNWIGSFGMTHYNMDDMPGIALGVALHLAQMMRSKRFRMYDYGSAYVNMQVYGTPQPLDIGANYDVIDIPVDVVAGKKDKLIPKSMVARHYQHLKEQGVKASYSEFEYAHLDFTFSNKEQVLEYVMSRLSLIEPNARHKKLKRKHSRSKSFREERKKEVDHISRGDGQVHHESSYERSTSEGPHRPLENGGDLKGKRGSSGGNLRETSVSAGRSGSLRIELPEGAEHEESEASGRNSLLHSQRTESSGSQDHMSYQDAHAAALKFVNDFPKSGFGMKDVFSSLRSRSSSLQSGASSPSHRSENPQQQSLSGRADDDREVHTTGSKSVLEDPSNLQKLHLLMSDWGTHSFSRKGGKAHRK
jgi:alpha-beta hydrolase superfamily lysophospholipase